MMRTAALSALPLLVLAGCMGGGSDPAGLPGTDDVSVQQTLVPTPSTTIDPKSVPKYHPHDMWGDRASILIFDAPITLGADLVEESYYREDALVAGHAEFNLRSDGDDSESNDKADVVFQGSKAIVAKLDWTPDDSQSRIPGITFLFKPANAARFTAVENAPKGQEIYIPISKGMADMPHQLKLSRWRFAVEAYDPQMATSPAKVHVAKGTVQVTITALNGGQRSIDPPHPYNFLDASAKPAGEISRTIDAQVLRNEEVGVHNQMGSSIQGWQVDAPHIIYWDSTIVKVWLHYNYTGPASAVPHELKLAYTDTTGPEVKAPAPASTGPGLAYYEIKLTGIEGDDPYAAKSDWTWGVLPVVNGQDDATEFAGNAHLRFVVEGANEVME